MAGFRRSFLSVLFISFFLCDTVSSLPEERNRNGWILADLALPSLELTDRSLFQDIFPGNDGLWEVYDGYRSTKPSVDTSFSLALRGSCAADIGRCAIVDKFDSHSDLERAMSCYIRAVHTGKHSAQCLSVVLMGLARVLTSRCIAGDFESCTSVQYLVQASAALFLATNVAPTPAMRAPITARAALSAALFHHIAMVKGKPLDDEHEGRKVVSGLVRAGLLSSDAANPRSVALFYGLEIAVLEEMRRPVPLCANSASALMAILGHKNMARKGLCPDICDQDGTLAIYMIASASPDTLDNSLPSYLSSGLLNCAAEARVVFQEHERWMSDLAHSYGMKVYGAEGVKRGIGESWYGQLLLKGVESIKRQDTGFSRYSLLLEEDFAAVEEAYPHTKQRLEDAMLLLSSGKSNAVRLRHTMEDGWPNYSKMHFERFGSVPETKLLDSVYWAEVDTIEQSSDIRRCGANGDFVCVGSHQGEYTNNPSLYEREWLMRIVGDVMKNSKGVSLEDNVNSWWTTAKGITTAQHRVGIFTHHRRDRPTTEVLEKYPDVVDHLIQWARLLLQVDQSSVKAIHISIFQVAGVVESDIPHLVEQKRFAVKIDGALSYDFFIQQLILEMHKLVLIEPNMTVRIEVGTDPTNLLQPLILELQLPGVV